MCLIITKVNVTDTYVVLSFVYKTKDTTVVCVTDSDDLDTTVVAVTILWQPIETTVLSRF